MSEKQHIVNLAQYVKESGYLDLHSAFLEYIERYFSE